jgi:hypothetical protein
MGISRLSVYLDDPSLRETVKIAAARRGVSISAYVLQALRDQLSREGLLHDERTAQEVARVLDALRAQVGPIGIPVRDLIDEGRYR